MNTVIRTFACAAFTILALHASAAQITVFAAASLTDSLRQLGAAYESKTGDKVIFNFAGSGQLARQIDAGARADIIISADEAHVDEFVKRDLLVKESRRNLLGNTLVVVVAPGETNLHTPADLTNASVKRIAVGETKTVPCGIYARDYLLCLGYWSAIEPKCIPCESVRAVLSTVESGNVGAGIVYKTDALISKSLKVACEVPSGLGPKITYPVALLKNTQQQKAAAKFLQFLESKESADVFRKFGFIVLEK